MPRDFQALFAEAAARIMELERENDELSQEVSHLRFRQGHIFECDDGSYAYEFGCSGGAHPPGIYGEITLVFVDPMGKESRRTYIAKDSQSQIEEQRSCDEVAAKS